MAIWWQEIAIWWQEMAIWRWEIAIWRQEIAIWRWEIAIWRQEIAIWRQEIAIRRREIIIRRWEIAIGLTRWQPECTPSTHQDRAPARKKHRGGASSRPRRFGVSDSVRRSERLVSRRNHILGPMSEKLERNPARLPGVAAGTGQKGRAPERSGLARTAGLGQRAASRRRARRGSPR
jgi:hypothetical protein